MCLKIKVGGIYGLQDNYLIGRKSFWWGKGMLFPFYLSSRGPYKLRELSFGVEVEADLVEQGIETVVKTESYPFHVRGSQKYFFLSLPKLGMHVSPYRVDSDKEWVVKTLSADEVLVAVFSEDILLGGSSLIVRKVTVLHPSLVEKWLEPEGTARQEEKYERLVKILKEGGGRGEV